MGSLDSLFLPHSKTNSHFEWIRKDMDHSDSSGGSLALPTTFPFIYHLPHAPNRPFLFLIGYVILDVMLGTFLLHWLPYGPYTSSKHISLTTIYGGLSGSQA